MPTARTCQRRNSPSKAGRRLSKRSPLSHPSGKDHGYLFHSTYSQGDVDKLLANGPILSETTPVGDLHHKEKGKVPGGMYFTDSVIAAAQFTCYNRFKGHMFNDDVAEKDKIAYVLMYRWEPPASAVLCETKTPSEQRLDKLCLGKDILTGPMKAAPVIEGEPGADDCLTSLFWQYAIVRQELINNNLKYKKTYQIPCANVPEGENLTEEVYAKGQPGQNPDAPPFSTFVAGLQSKTPGSPSGSMRSISPKRNSPISKNQGASQPAQGPAPAALQKGKSPIVPMKKSPSTSASQSPVKVKKPSPVSKKTVKPPPSSKNVRGSAPKKV